MYFELYFIAGIVIFVIILYKFIELIYDSNNYSQKYAYVYAILLFLVIIATFANIIISIYSYRTTINMAGVRGDKGIKGTHGKKGNTGICGEKCGQQVCYTDIIDHANSVFLEEINKLGSGTNSVTSTVDSNSILIDKIPDDEKKKMKIKNGYFLQIINNICKSQKYQSIMLGKHPNKPSEKKLIEYLKEIIEEWIVYLCDPINSEIIDNGKNINDVHKNIRFLLEPHWDKTMLNYDKKDGNPFNPFNELDKYEIWTWGSDQLIIKSTKRKLNINIIDRPEPDTARLYIKKTNNYKTQEFNTKTKPDKWDDSQCEYGQMGKDKTNPNNLSKCVFINENYLKGYVNTWKTDVYRKDKELSLYNTASTPYSDKKTKQEFYPVGSVWRGKDDNSKPKGCEVTPSDSDINADKSFGPEKETILVSGDVKSPVRYDLLWNNTSGCSDCQTNSVNIYRPVAPKGYVCLGDYAKQGKDSTLSIKDTYLMVYYDYNDKRIRYTDKLNGTTKTIDDLLKTNFGETVPKDNIEMFKGFKDLLKTYTKLDKIKYCALVKKSPAGTFTYVTDISDYPTYFAKKDIEKLLNSNIDDTDFNDSGIKCVPKECVRETSIGSNFWNNKNISYDKYDSYEKYISKTPYSSDTQLGASFWAAGIDSLGSAEEQANLYGQEFIDDGGYNLFRLNKGFREPNDLKTYTIKEECLMPGSGKIPAQLRPNLDTLKDKNTFEDEYGTDVYFGTKPGLAVLTFITFIDTQKIDLGSDPKIEYAGIYNFKHKSIKIYMIDDGTPGVDDNPFTYFLATFNEKKNDFSKYIITNKNKTIQFTETPSKTNNYHRWCVSNPFTGPTEVTELDKPVTKVDIKSYSDYDSGTNFNSNNVLKHFYDTMGKGHFWYDTISEFSKKITDEGCWRYDSFKKGIKYKDFIKTTT